MLVDENKVGQVGDLDSAVGDVQCHVMKSHPKFGYACTSSNDPQDVDAARDAVRKGRLPMLTTLVVLLPIDSLSMVIGRRKPRNLRLARVSCSASSLTS